MKLSDLGSDIDRRWARNFLRSFDGMPYLGPTMMEAVKLLFEEVGEDVPPKIVLYTGVKA